MQIRTIARPLCVALLAALPAFAQTFPLGHHRHEFQRAQDRVPAQGWDPSYSEAHQSDKDRMTTAVATHPVGLPGTLEPADLGNSGCPANTTIDGSWDVRGLPTVTLSGVDGAIPLVTDCARPRDELRVLDGMRVAVHGSAFRKIDYQGGSTEGSRIWFVDGLLDADPNDNAAVLCAQAECNLIHSEVLGGDDGIKVGNGGLYTLGLHVHGLDREPNSKEHNDGVQHSPDAGPAIFIASNVEGPMRTSNAPYFVATNTVIGETIFANGLLTGGTHPFKLGKKKGHHVRLPVLLDSRLLGDQQNVSWGGRGQKHLPGCFLGNSREHFRGEGNAASDGTTSGVENLATRSWSVDAACNGRPVPQDVKDRIAAKRKQLETWRDEIRAAAARARR